MKDLIYPQAPYTMEISMDKSSNRYILEFIIAPEDLVRDVLMALGFIPIENGKKFYLINNGANYTEELIRWTIELKDCLAMQCFPEKLPYRPENPPSFTNLQEERFGLVTLEYKSGSSRNQKVKYVIFDYSSGKRQGFANLIGYLIYKDKFIRAKTARKNVIKKSKPLFFDGRIITTVQYPFGAGCPPLDRENKHNPLLSINTISIVADDSKIEKQDEGNGFNGETATSEKSEIEKPIDTQIQDSLGVQKAQDSSRENGIESDNGNDEETTVGNEEETTVGNDVESNVGSSEESSEGNENLDSPKDSKILQVTISDKVLQKSKLDNEMDEGNAVGNTVGNDVKPFEGSSGGSSEESSEELGENKVEKNIKKTAEKTSLDSKENASENNDIVIPEKLSKDLEELVENNTKPMTEKAKIDPRRKRKKGVKPVLKASSVIQQPYTKIFMKLHQLVPNLEKLLDKGNLYMKSTFSDGKSEPAIMDFSLELLQTDIDQLLYTISMSHYYKMNGDLVPDPDMSVTIDFVMQTAQANHYQDLRTYTKIDENTAPQTKRSINEFLLQWITNLINQGHIMDEHTIINSGHDEEPELEGKKMFWENLEETLAKKEDERQVALIENVVQPKKITFLPDKVQLKLAVLTWGEKGVEEKIRCTSWEEVGYFEKHNNLKLWKDGKVSYEIFWEDNTTFQEVLYLKNNQLKKHILGKTIFTEIVLCIQSLENRLEDFQCFTDASIDDFNRYLKELDFGFNPEDYIKGLAPKIPLKLFSVHVTNAKYHHKKAHEKNSKVKTQIQQLQWVGSLAGSDSNKVKAVITLWWADGKKISITKSPMEIPKEVGLNIIYELVNETEEKLVVTHQTNPNQAHLFPTEYVLEGFPLYYKSIVGAYFRKGAEVKPSDLIVWENAVIVLSKLKGLLQIIFSKMTVVEKLSVFQKIIDSHDSSKEEKRSKSSSNSEDNYLTLLRELLSTEVNLEGDTAVFQKKCDQCFTQVMDSYSESFYFKDQNFGFLIDILCTGDLTMIDLPQEEDQQSQPLTLTEKERLTKNTEIEKLLDDKGEKGNYTKSEKELLSQYSGYGGLKKAGVQKGRLHEFFTPDSLAEVMWELAASYGYKGGDFLEPSVGTGVFLKHASRAKRIVGFEVNPYSAMICKVLFPEADIIDNYFESIFFRGNKHLKNDFVMKPFDLVIGNPPYGEFSSFYAGLGERKFTKATQYDQYFITRGLDLLKSGGILVMLISSYFHRADSGYDSVKKLIASKALLLRKITLPNGVVPYTEVGTDIVIYKKR